MCYSVAPVYMSACSRSVWKYTYYIDRLMDLGEHPAYPRKLGEDPHLWATTLFDVVVALGYQDRYFSMKRA